MEESASFGNWVRHRRKILDMTQADLARKISCSLSMLRKIERDERRPSEQLAELLADHLALDAAQRDRFLAKARGHFVPELPPPAAVPFDHSTNHKPVPESRSRDFSRSTFPVLLLLLLLAALAAGQFGFFSAGSRERGDRPAGFITATGQTGASLAATASAAQPLAGTTVVIEASFGNGTLDLFEQSLRPFEEQTGIEVQVRSIPEIFERYITNVVSAGNPPDIVAFPQPGYLADFARRGQLVPLDSFLTKHYLRQQYSPPFLELATVDGHVVGAWHLVSLKGLVWYPKAAFATAGYAVPQTWDELLALSEQIAADGRTPWCIGVENRDASGWQGTDWAETLLLRTAPPATYDAWVKGELPFTSPEVRRVFGLMERIWFDNNFVAGGTASIAQTAVFHAADPMFADPPGCYLHMGASWSPGFFPETAVFGEDYDYFLFPPVDPQYGAPLLGDGGIYAMFHDRPEVREVIRYLTTGKSIKAFAEAGYVISAHRDAPLEWFTSPRQIRYVQTMSAAGTYRFDGSDLMPGEVGFQFWQGIVDWVNGQDLDTVLNEIDAKWPADDQPASVPATPGE